MQVWLRECLWCKWAIYLHIAGECRPLYARIIPGISSLLSGRFTQKHLAIFNVRHIRYLPLSFGRQPLSSSSAWIGSTQVRVSNRML